MDQFSERLAGLSGLSDEDLAALESEMVSAFDNADASGDIDTMQSIADGLDRVRAEIDNRSNAAAQEAPAEETPAPAAAPAPAVAASADAPAVEVTVPVEVEQSQPEPEAPDESTSSESEVTAEAEDPGSEEEVSEPEAAANADDQAPENATSDSEPDTKENPVAAEDITAAEVPEDNRPVQAAAYTIRAGGNIPGVTAGEELVDLDAVSKAMAAKIDTLRAGSGDRVLVASITTAITADENHTLRPGDAMGNARKIRDFLSDRDQLTPEGLTAAAWCAPRAPIYDVPTMGSTRRPVQAGLPTFNADRGGIVWMQPPSLTASDAVSLWRHDGDEWLSYTDVLGENETSPAATKPCFTVPCGTEQTADVDAIPMCLCFDNLTARAFPEWIRANTDLTMVAQARFAEQIHLAQMFGVVTTGSCGSVTTQVGVARDFLLPVRSAAASKRWQLRLDPNAPMQLLAPAWVKTAMAVDLGLQMPGDNTISVGEDVIEGYFREANVQPIWYIDDAPGTAAFNTCAFPNAAHWLLFPTGTFIRLDNGELNLGVTRSKEDIQANRYCEFSETFETVAYMGPADHSWLTRGLTDVDIIGGAAALIDTTP